MDIYRRLVRILTMYICVTKLIVRDDVFFKWCAVCRSCLYTLQKVGKAGIVLKPEQLQAVRHVYKGRDVFLWLLTGFVKPWAMKFSLILRPSHKAAMYEGPGYEATTSYPAQSRFVGGASWARYVYDVFYGEKNEIRCACTNSVYQALSPLCGRGLGTRLSKIMLEHAPFKWVAFAMSSHQKINRRGFSP